MGHQIHLISGGVINIVYYILAPCVPYFRLLKNCGLHSDDVRHIPCYIISNIGYGTLTVVAFTWVLCISCDMCICFLCMLSFLQQGYLNFVGMQKKF